MVMIEDQECPEKLGVMASLKEETVNGKTAVCVIQSKFAHFLY